MWTFPRGLGWKPLAAEWAVASLARPPPDLPEVSRPHQRGGERAPSPTPRDHLTPSRAHGSPRPDPLLPPRKEARCAGWRDGVGGRGTCHPRVWVWGLLPGRGVGGAGSVQLMASGVHVVFLYLETLASQLVTSRFASVGQDRHRELTFIVVGFGWVMTQFTSLFFKHIPVIFWRILILT